MLGTCNVIIFSEQKAKDRGVGAAKAGCPRRDRQLGAEGDPKVGHALTKTCSHIGAGHGRQSQWLVTGPTASPRRGK